MSSSIALWLRLPSLIVCIIFRLFGCFVPFRQAQSAPPQGREEQRLLPSPAERAEATLFLVQELYMVDPSLVARVMPNLQTDILKLGSKFSLPEKLQLAMLTRPESVRGF